MATTLAELEIKLKSDLAEASAKDQAALRKTSVETKAAQQALAALQGQQIKSAAAGDLIRKKEASGLAMAGAKSGAAQALLDQKAQAALAILTKKGELAASLSLQKSEAAQALAIHKENAKGAAAFQLERQREVFKLLQTDRANERKSMLQTAKAATSGGAAALGGKDGAPAIKETAAATKALDSAQQGGITSGILWADVIKHGANIAKQAAVAVVEAGIAYLTFASNAASAARSQNLLSEALTGSKALGTEFTAIINQLSKEVPMAKEQIAGLAQELSLLRLGRRDLQAGLTSIAIVTSVLGDSAGNAVKSIVTASAAARRFQLGARDLFGEFTGLAGTGIKSADVIGALAAQLKISRGAAEEQLRAGRVTLKQGMLALEEAARGRFGKILQLQMLDINVQTTKAKENLKGMFSGVNQEPALRGLRELLSILDQNTVAGKAMKVILTAGLDSISRALGVVLPIGKELFLGLAIGALTAYLAIRPLARGIMGMVTALGLGKGSLDWVTVGRVLFVGLAAALATIATLALLVAGPFVAMGLAIYGVGKAASTTFQGIVSAASAMVGYLSKIDLASIGTSMVMALASGISSAGPAVLKAMGAVAEGAISSFKNKIAMRSPPKVFTDIGRAIPLAAAGGVEREIPALERATEEMGGAAIGGAMGGAGGAARGGAGGAGGGATINFNGDVYFGGTKASASEKRSLADELRAMLSNGGQAPIGAT